MTLKDFLVAYVYIDATDDENSYFLTDVALIEHLDKDGYLNQAILTFKQKYASPMNRDNVFRSINEFIENSEKLIKNGKEYIDPIGCRRVKFPPVICLN